MTAAIGFGLVIQQAGAGIVDGFAIRGADGDERMTEDKKDTGTVSNLFSAAGIFRFSVVSVATASPFNASLRKTTIS
jgi:hypothetical protein